jgi:hypothetical protein
MRKVVTSGNQPRRSRRGLKFDFPGFGYWLGLPLMTAALSLSAAAGANEMESFIDRMPRAYSGEFVAGDGRVPQSITITFETVRALSDDKAEALGCAAYEAHRETTTLKVRMFVRLSDLRVEIWEESPQGNTPVESQQGHFSEDLQRIDAQSMLGQHEQLQLHAVASATCAPMLSL